MPRLSNSLPKYRKHRASGQAVVTIEGRDFYLGPHRTKASRLEYDRIIAEYLAAGRRLPGHCSGTSITVVELTVRYVEFAKGYYVKNGRPTNGDSNLKYAVKSLCRLYGRVPVDQFGPLALKAVREEMLNEDLSRTTVNMRIQRIVQIFSWGVEEELVSPSTVAALREVRGLRKGKTRAREGNPVRPVDDATIEATLPHLPPIVADMVRLQRLTGMRPNEILQVRPVDVDRRETIWKYVPREHKTEGHGKERYILFGPKAQAILTPYLDRPEEEFCFSPMESEQLRHIDQRRKRKTKVQPSQRNRKKKKPERPPKVQYTNASYRRAITRACDAAGVERWTPNRLRHTAATEIRRRFGIEASKVILGHSNLQTSLIYAEDDLKQAERIAGEIG